MKWQTKIKNWILSSKTFAAIAVLTVAGAMFAFLALLLWFTIWLNK